MSNLKRLNLENHPSFITTKTINNTSFFSKKENAETVISSIYFGRKSNWFNLIAFVVMPDHIHLIIIPKQKKYFTGNAQYKEFFEQRNK